MNPEFANGLIVLVYLILGTVSIAVLMSWALKRFGPPKQGGSQPAGREEQKPGSSR